MESCAVDGCERPIKVKKERLCGLHYARFRRHGDPLAWKKRRRQECSVDGCSLLAAAHGLCDRHYRRMRRYGTTDAPARPTVCTVEGCGRSINALSLCDRHYRRVLKGDDGPRHCGFCGAELDPNAHAQAQWCSKQCKEKSAYLKRRDEHRGRWLKRYGLTVEQYESMLVAQGAACAVCQSADPRGRAGSPHFVVDHDHATGAVRGLLCAPCNSGMGSFGDSPAALRAAADYLERGALPSV